MNDKLLFKSRSLKLDTVFEVVDAKLNDPLWNY